MKTLYYGGPIITMEQRIYAEAVLTENGRITAVGEKGALEAMGPEKRFDLQGRTMMPAFLDAHSHLVAMARTLSMVDLTGAGSIGQIQERIRAFLEKNPGADFVFAFGYDQNELFEHRHPNRRELDVATGEIPMILSHASGHMGVANSAGLRLMGVTAETRDPEGGRIGREADGEPDGYLEENSFFQASRSFPEADRGSLALKVTEAERLYGGYALLQEGKATEQEWDVLHFMAENRMLKKDVVCYVDMKGCPELLERYPEYRSYRNHLRLGGYKFFLDGSPQGRTAWLSEPYSGEAEYRGYGSYGDDEVRAMVRKAYEERVQILVHANGDRAIEQFLEACEEVGPGIGAIRPVLIHGQLLRRDQIPRLKALGVIPSLFVAHTYHWGDVHIANLGVERAALISPCASAVREKLPLTLHTDSPVILPDAMETVWCACKRQTRSGIVLGEEEQLSVLAALKAMTLNTAYQYFEEEERGSIREGKRAEFVLLNQNPIITPVDSLRQVKILSLLNG